VLEALVEEEAMLYNQVLVVHNISKGVLEAEALEFLDKVLMGLLLLAHIATIL
jgi:hypothetical protein